MTNINWYLLIQKNVNLICEDKMQISFVRMGLQVFVKVIFIKRVNAVWQKRNL